MHQVPHSMFKIRTRTVLLPALLLTATLISCRKDEPLPPSGDGPAPTFFLSVGHHIDGEALAYDSILYVNEAGHHYSVTRLEYYLSGLVLKGTGGTPDHVVEGPWYINGTWGNSFELGRVPDGDYNGISVQLGLPPALNQTNALPNTMENVNMAWPIPMGGGYHFMKFEGHFLHQDQPTGFAMHLGRDEHLVHCDMPGAFSVAGNGGQLDLRFNLNEVFRDPHTYDLAAGNQSMGSDSLMALLRDNCTNAFTFTITP